MEAKAFLEEIRLLKQDIQKARVEYRVQAMWTRETLERVQERLDGLQQLRDAKMEKVVAGLLRMKTPEAALIVCLRYLEGRDWESIEEVIPFSRSQIFRLHNKGLQELSETLPSA